MFLRVYGLYLCHNFAFHLCYSFLFLFRCKGHSPSISLWLCLFKCCLQVHLLTCAKICATYTCCSINGPICHYVFWPKGRTVFSVNYLSLRKGNLILNGLRTKLWYYILPRKQWTSFQRKIGEQNRHIKNSSEMFRKMKLCPYVSRTGDFSQWLEHLRTKSRHVDMHSDALNQQEKMG